MTMQSAERSKKPGKIKKVLFCLIIAVLLVWFVLFVIGMSDKVLTCRLPLEYYDSKWECAASNIFMTVDNEGYCKGTIDFGGILIPVDIMLDNRNCAFIQAGEGSTRVSLFDGKYKANSNRIVLIGEWSSHLEERYHQPYDEGECTLVFERVE